MRGLKLANILCVKLLTQENSIPMNSRMPGIRGSLSTAYKYKPFSPYTESSSSSLLVGGHALQ